MAQRLEPDAEFEACLSRFIWCCPHLDEPAAAVMMLLRTEVAHSHWNPSA